MEYDKKALAEAAKRRERIPELKARREVSERFRKELASRQPELERKLEEACRERNELSEKMNKSVVSKIKNRKQFKTALAEADRLENEYRNAGGEYDSVMAELSEIDRELAELEKAEDNYKEILFGMTEQARKSDTPEGRKIQRLCEEKEQLDRRAAMLQPAIERCGDVIKTVSDFTECLAQYGKVGFRFSDAVLWNETLSGDAELVRRSLEKLYETRAQMEPEAADLIPTEALSTAYGAIKDGIVVSKQILQDDGSFALFLKMFKDMNHGADSIGNRMLAAVKEYRKMAADTQERQAEISMKIEAILSES